MSLWTEVDAASFEPTLGRELMKYEKFKSGLEDNAAKQAEVLSSIKVRIIERHMRRIIEFWPTG